MKVIENIEHVVESKGFGGAVPIRLQFTLVLLRSGGALKYDQAQMIICDTKSQFENMVCAMNLGQLSCTKLIDDMNEITYRTQSE